MDHPELYDPSIISNNPNEDYSNDDQIWKNVKDLTKRLQFLENSHQELLGTFNRLVSLIEMQEKIAAERNVHDICMIAVEHIQKFVSTKGSAVLLVDKESFEFKLEYAEPNKSKASFSREMNMQIDNGTFGWVVGQKKPTVVPTLYLGRKGKRRGTLIFAPLSFQQSILGMLCILTDGREKYINQEALDLLWIMAKILALTLQNVYLFNDIVEYSQNLEDKVDERTKALKEAQAELVKKERLSAALETITTINHEVNNPLCAISGNAQLLIMSMKDKKSPDKNTERLEEIVLQCNRIFKINDRLRKISRVASSQYLPGVNMLDIKQSHSAKTEKKKK